MTRLQSKEMLEWTVRGINGEVERLRSRANELEAMARGLGKNGIAPPKTMRKMSEEGRQRIRDAMRKRWAEHNAQKGTNN